MLSEALHSAQSCTWKRNIANKRDELISGRDVRGGGRGGTTNSFGNDIMLVTSNYWWQQHKPAPAWHRCVIWLAAADVRATRIYTLHIGSCHYYLYLLHFSTTGCVNVYFSPKLFLLFVMSLVYILVKHHVWAR